MFQGLSQGAVVSVLYRSEPRVVDGKVLSVNTHMPVYNANQPMAMFNGPVTDISVQVGNEMIPFAGLPANGIVANFPDKGVFISTDKSAVIREIESMRNSARQALEQAPAHEKMVSSCDALLVELQPEKRKEAKQEKELEDLRGQISAMGAKMDRLMALLAATTGTVTQNNGG